VFPPEDLTPWSQTLTEKPTTEEIPSKVKGKAIPVTGREGP
jgi:hypothetical protein